MGSRSPKATVLSALLDSILYRPSASRVQNDRKGQSGVLEKLFVSKVRVKILTLFLKGQGESYHVREITRRVGTEINAVRRELKRLTKVGLLKRKPLGNKIFFRVNPDFPLYNELLGLIAKEKGLGKSIIANSDELGKVKFAMLSLPFVKGREAGSNDVDLLLVGAVDLKLLRGFISEAEKEHGHEINYTVMGEEEFEFRKARKDPFLIQVLMQPRIILLGDEEKFCTVS